MADMFDARVIVGFTFTWNVAPHAFAEKQHENNSKAKAHCEGHWVPRVCLFHGRMQKRLLCKTTYAWIDIMCCWCVCVSVCVSVCACVSVCLCACCACV